MNKFRDTLLEILNILGKNKIQFALTRFDKNNPCDPNDLDILVMPDSFYETIRVLEGNGYISSSHDKALGGRIKSMQMNLTKTGRIKIDLHQDFTWRASRYFDLYLVWDNLKTKRVQGVEYQAPEDAVDVFIILINIIFEKTYLKESDYAYIKENIEAISKNPIFTSQAKKYGWLRSFSWFVTWFGSIEGSKTWPVFLPVGLVVSSYFEKFLHDKNINITSLLYYIFFRTRFILNGALPYD